MGKVVEAMSKKVPLFRVFVLAGLSAWSFVLLGGVIAVGTRNKMVLEFWGSWGDVMEPMGAVLSGFAVFVALWSVDLQRAELEAQRQELRDNREVMKEQQAQFEKTAKAQEALAASQERLAAAQERANKIAVRAERTQRLVATSTLQAAITHMHQAMAGHDYWRQFAPELNGERAREQLARMETSLNLIAAEARRESSKGQDAKTSQG